MAQAGYTPISLYYSTTSTQEPAAADLVSGELAINIADGKLFYKNSGGNVRLLSIGYGSSTVTPTNGGVQYGTGTALALTAAGSSGQILRSNGAAAPTWADLSTLGVNTISFGTTGLTPNSATAGAVTVAGTLVTANGGTGLGGATPFTANGVLYASSASALTSGSALTFDGTTLSLNGGSNGTRLAVKGTGAFGGFDTGAATDGRIEYAYNGTNTFYTGIDSASLFTLMARSGVSLAFGANGSEAMRLTSTGLGIGTSSPGYKLDVSIGNVSGAKMFKFTGATAGGSLFGYSDSGGVGITRTDPYNSMVYFGTGNTVEIYTASTQRAVFDSSGNLGIGTSSPGYKLEVNGGASDAMSLFNSTNANGAHLRFAASGTVKSYIGGAPGFLGSGTADDLGIRAVGSVLFATNGSSVDMTLDSSGNLGIGTSSPAARLDVVNNATYQLRVASTTSDYANGGIYLGALGTSDPFYYGYVQYVQSDQTLRLGNQSYSATGGIAFYVGTTSTPTERARITSGGDLLVGTTGNTRAGVVAYFASNDIFNSHSGAAAGAVTSLYTGWYGATSTTTGTLSFNVTTNGDVTNTNNSYGAISDAKLKENIVDASPKLADLMQVRVRNYNFKEGQTHKQIGVVAQELEQIFPSMVNESPDRDADGNDLGTTTKQVKYSVFVPMLIKAIQEQQTLIESLTSRVAQLEGTQP